MVIPTTTQQETNQPEQEGEKTKSEEKSDDVTVSKEDDVINSKGEEVLKMLVTKYLQQNVAMATVSGTSDQSEATTSKGKKGEVGCHSNLKLLGNGKVGWQRSLTFVGGWKIYVLKINIKMIFIFNCRKVHKVSMIIKTKNVVFFIVHLYNKNATQKVGERCI